MHNNEGMLDLYSVSYPQNFTLLIISCSGPVAECT